MVVDPEGPVKSSSRPALTIEGALILTVASIAGCATVGAAIGNYIRPDFSGMAAILGAIVGLVASIADNVKSSSSK